MDNWDRIHDQIEQELNDGIITHEEAYQCHKQVEQEEQDYLEDSKITP